MKLFSPASIINQHKKVKPGQQEDEPPDPTCVTLPDQLSQSTLDDQIDLLKELLGRNPVSHYWDPTESRMLMVKYEALGGETGKKGGKLDSWLATMGRAGKHAQVRKTSVPQIFQLHPKTLSL